MLDINQLLNIGNESAGYENPKSLLDEMMEEIGFESDIDNAIYEADATAVTSAASIVENVYAVMAEREAGIEGASVLEAYKGFGLEGSLVNFVGQEALTDVVSRKAYSGITQLKSLINTLITWVSKVLGLSANTKKIFKSLSEKAKKVRKELSKARAALSAKALKNGDDKELTREIPDYAGESNVTNFGINTVTYIYGRIKADFDSIDKGLTINNAKIQTSSVSTSTDLETSKKEGYAEKIKTWKEDTKDEKTGNDIISEVAKALDLLVSAKSNSTDIQKSADKLKKKLEKLRKDLETANKSNASADLSADHETINKYIAQVSLDAAYMTMFAKFYVRVADEVFTDAKWLIMKAA